jgi:hypothetical protein
MYTETFAQFKKRLGQLDKWLGAAADDAKSKSFDHHAPGRRDREDYEGTAIRVFSQPKIEVGTRRRQRPDQRHELPGRDLDPRAPVQLAGHPLLPEVANRRELTGCGSVRTSWNAGGPGSIPP